MTQELLIEIDETMTGNDIPLRDEAFDWILEAWESAEAHGWKVSSEHENSSQVSKTFILKSDEPKDVDGITVVAFPAMNDSTLRVVLRKNGRIVGSRKGTTDTEITEFAKYGKSI